MKITAVFLLSASMFLLHSATAGEPTDLRPYPAAEAGFARMVFRVSPVDDESARKVEIIVGKTLSVDCNLALKVIIGLPLAFSIWGENSRAFNTK